MERPCKHHAVLSVITLLTNKRLECLGRWCDSRDRHTLLREAEARGVDEALNGGAHVGRIVRRLAHAHEYDVGQGRDASLFGDALGPPRLHEDLISGQAAE